MNHHVTSRKLRIQEVMLSHLQRLEALMDFFFQFSFQDNTSTLVSMLTLETKVQDRNMSQLVSIRHSHWDLLAQVQQWAPTAVSHLERSK